MPNMARSSLFQIGRLPSSINLREEGPRVSYNARRWYFHIVPPSSGAPLPGGACLGSFSSITVRHLEFKGRYAKIIGKITMTGLPIDKFIEICAIMASPRQFGYKRGNLSRLNSVGGLSKTIFALRWARLPNNLRISISLIHNHSSSKRRFLP
jgi:hypothetical protein